MRIFDVLALLLLLLFCRASGLTTPSVPSAADAPDYVKVVHVISSNHLDVGFNTAATQPNTYLAADVIDEYNRYYFTRAINTAQTLRDMMANGTNPNNVTFTWTTQPWVVSLYFDCPPNMGFYCPTTAEKEAVRAGILRKDITWHACQTFSRIRLQSSPLTLPLRASHSCSPFAMSRPSPPSVCSSLSVALIVHSICAPVTVRPSAILLTHLTSVVLSLYTVAVTVPVSQWRAGGVHSGLVGVRC